MASEMPSPLQLVFVKLRVLGRQFVLHPGSCVRVVGDVLPDAKRFGVELGTDENNLALHFNPRFNFSSDRNTVVFNNKYKGKYGQEYREHHFPFQSGARVEILIVFEGKSFVVKLADGSQMTFPNRHETTEITYLNVFGDIITKALAFE